MGYIILVIFIFTALLCYLEDYIKKYRLPLYLLIGLILILVAGLREVGIDPDSENYEYTYQYFYANNVLDGVEFSYILLSSIFNYITNDVHILFLFYALWGVSIKLFAIRTTFNLWFTAVLVYIAFYFELHELTQIRTGILSGLLLLAIKPIADGKRKLALAILAIGFFFHTSGLLLMPLVLLKNKPMTIKQRILWGALIPLSYCIYFTGTNLIMNVDIPYIGDKLAMYQKSVDKGILTVTINVFSPLQLFSLVLYYYLLYFHDTIIQFNKYFPLMIKILTLGLFSFATFAILPVFAQRVCYLLSVVNVCLYPYIIYTFKQKWIGITVMVLISLIILNYGMGYIKFPLLWKVG